MRAGIHASAAFPAETADLGDGLYTRSPAAERLDVVHVTLVIDVGHQRDVCIGPCRERESAGDIFLEAGESIHVGTGCSEHVVAPEDHLHLQAVVPDKALDQLEAGAVVQGFVYYRVPGDRYRSPGLTGLRELLPYNPPG